jgi:hypothetical protein
MDVSSGPLSEVVSTGPLSEVVSTGPLSEVASSGPLSEVAGIFVEAALCHSSRGLCLGWLGDVVGVFVVSCFPKTEFFVFCSLECSGGGRSAVGFHGNEKYMAVPLGAGVQGDGWHCLEFLRN